MADGHGGYRKPEKPAAVSGPGKYSARTDGQPGAQPIRALPDAGYGEQADYTGLQQAAPLASSQGMPAPQAPQGGGAGQPGPTPVPLSAPEQNPGVPITHGLDVGPGAGPEVLGDPTAQRTEDAAKLADYLPMLLPHARNPKASQSYRTMVRLIQNSVQQQQMDGYE